MKRLGTSGGVARERLLRTRDIMKRVLPAADVRNYEHRIEDLILPDPDDRHVLAAAIEAGAEAIIGFNLRDFPSAALVPHGIAARHPDEFLCTLHADDRAAVAAVVQAARQNLSRSAPSLQAYLDTLENQGLPGLAARLKRQRLDAGDLRVPEAGDLTDQVSPRD